MKKVLLALLGLILLAILGYFCFKDKADSIRQELVSSTNDALSSHGITGVQATLEGDDIEMTDIINLTGEVPTQEAKAQAETLAKSVLGVSAVNNLLKINGDAVAAVTPTKTSTPAPTAQDATPYVLTIAKDSDGKVSLEGLVADEAQVKLLVKKAKKIFGAKNVINHLSVKADAPQDWEHITQFSLDRLADVDYGDMKLHNQSYEFTAHLSSPSKKANFLDGIREVMSDPENKYGRYRGDYIITAPIDEPVVVTKKPVPITKPATKVVTKPAIVPTVQASTPVVVAQRMSTSTCQSLVDDLLRDQKVLFDYNKATIKRHSHQLLSQIANTLQDCQISKVQIGGHTDNIGRDSYNQKLSERRARNVKRYLVKQGLSSNSLEAVGYGESQPIVSNKTSQSRAKNRRIEFIVKGVK